MKINKKLVVNLVAFLIIFIPVYLYMADYRLNGIEASKAHFDIGEDAKLFETANYKWGSVYLFKTPTGPCTAISQKLGFLWKTKTSFYMKNIEDLVSTVGWANNDKCTVYAVESSDNNLAYIEIGTGIDKIRIYSEHNKPMIFQWDKSINLNDFNGIAYSKTGDAIYEFRYPKGNTITMGEMRWFPIK